LAAERIFAEASELLSNETVYQQMATAINPFGDGHASERILNSAIDFLKGEK